MSTSVNQIKEKISEKRDYLNKELFIQDMGIFGSVARGDNTESSDIDLLVTFSKPIGMFAFIETEEYLSKLLGKKVDLVTKKALKTSIKEDILQQLIYV